jgi:hypothetical protein
MTFVRGHRRISSTGFYRVTPFLWGLRATGLVLGERPVLFILRLQFRAEGIVDHILNLFVTGSADCEGTDNVFLYKHCMLFSCSLRKVGAVSRRSGLPAHAIGFGATGSSAEKMPLFELPEARRSNRIHNE